MSELVARLRPYRWNLVGLVLGALLGALYAHFIGCRQEGCAILSSRLLSGIVGGILGASLFGGKDARPAQKQSEA